MVAITICWDFGAEINKVCHCFHCFPIYLHEVVGPDALILVFWMLSFKPTFSLSSFTFIKRLFSSSLLSAIKMVSFVYLSWNSTSLGAYFLIIHVRSCFSVIVVVHQHTYFRLQMCVWIDIWVASRMGFLGRSDSKESAYNVVDLSSIPVGKIL